MSIVQTNVSLKPYNTFGIDINAQYFAEVFGEDDLSEVLKDPRFKALPKLVLGGGSNILFTQDFPGLVIKNSLVGFQVVAKDPYHVWLEVGAGELWHQFVMYCCARDYAGVENMALIPGKVGAAPIQNIGAYGAEISDVFVELTAIELKGGQKKQFLHADCQFGYRDSIFKHQWANQLFITRVVMKLNKTPTLKLNYGEVQATLQTMGITAPTIRDVSAAVMQIRQRKLPDPTQLGNAGSFFKNPVISQTQLQTLQKQFNHVPHFPNNAPHNPQNSVKIPAGWLIEQCGFKGLRQGDAGVHSEHALVLVNFGQATGLEIKQLADQIQNTVKQRFGVELETEVNIL